jgi:hypothetical protein
MPKVVHQRLQISRLHTNELFREIEAHYIPVADFELTERAVDISMIPGFITPGRRISYPSWPVTVVSHPGTKSIFTVAVFNSKSFICRAMVNVGIPDEVLRPEWRDRHGRRGPWGCVRGEFAGWLEGVRGIEYLRNVPDLWGELRQGRKFLGELHEEDVEDTPFTSDEQAEVSGQIKQTRDYVKTTFELTSEQISQVDAKLDQAEQASRHMARKDWLMLFNGAVFSLILTDIITPQAAEHIIMLTIQGLGHLFGFGAPPPQLPLGR